MRPVLRIGGAGCSSRGRNSGDATSERPPWTSPNLFLSAGAETPEQPHGGARSRLCGTGPVSEASPARLRPGWTASGSRRTRVARRGALSTEGLRGLSSRARVALGPPPGTGAECAGAWAGCVGLLVAVAPPLQRRTERVCPQPLGENRLGAATWYRSSGQVEKYTKGKENFGKN
ncbi:hypothetical protein NDU88_002192 [Pleurodeles waltl]|uniref:Uncharacterized protein n=1 Tax=Pleurodeles waltl TaxID=8319 RepID=A0AAV7VBV6_PLEWA|nr:hypothetical protein NDU88_002192 [Pleurodeles waltl]